MGKSLTLLPECRECTSACPNKPAERKMRREQTRTNEGCQNESRAAPGCERSGDRAALTARDGDVQGMQGSAPAPPVLTPSRHPSTGSRAPSRKARDGWTKRKVCGHGSWEVPRPWAGLSPRGSQGWSKEGSAKRDVPSPRQPRSQEIHGISPSAASLCSELRQHE